MADNKLSEYLRLNAGMPVLHLEQKFEMNNPEIRIYSSIYCNTEDQEAYGIFLVQ